MSSAWKLKSIVAKARKACELLLGHTLVRGVLEGQAKIVDDFVDLRERNQNNKPNGTAVYGKRVFDFFFYTRSNILTNFVCN